MSASSDHEKSTYVYHGSPDALRSAERVREMEVERVVDLTLEAFTCVEDKEPLSLVDVGTGSGLFAEAFYRRGLSVAGVDPNPAMLDLARETLPGVTFYPGSAEALPCADKEFDLVFMGMVFHEIDDQTKALREAARVAKLGIALLEWPPRITQHGPPLEHRVKLASLARMCQSVGLEKPVMVELTHKVIFLITAKAQ